MELGNTKTTKFSSEFIQYLTVGCQILPNFGLKYYRNIGSQSCLYE